jgi:protein-L-isoaspartate(D-aspartate) O-methyltransferase
VDADEALVTQLDDGHPDGPRTATSSASMPSLVARMLAELDARPGHRVLEIGTGTGWSTALLCARVGDAGVVSVELDDAVAARAARALAAAGRTPRLRVGDGCDGWAEGAPWDRVISTAAVAEVPYAWVEQAAGGAVIVTPFGTPFCNAGLLRLRKDGESGGASGRFVGSVSFMWVRGQRPRGGAGAAPADDVAYGASGLAPGTVLASVHAAFAVGLRVPGARYREVWNDADRRGTRRLEVWDGAGSRAEVSWHGWERRDGVRQSGPRRLWDEVGAAYAWWEARGRPELTRFGVTRDAEGQRVWLDTPDAESHAP